jgi:hypothetical protein
MIIITTFMYIAKLAIFINKIALMFEQYILIS